MKIIDVFIEKAKHKFLNHIIKIPKNYDWYLGLVTELDDFDLIRDESIDEFITHKCEKIYDKSEQHIKLLQICSIDDYTLIIFGIDPAPFNNNIKGILNSICKYLDCKKYKTTFLKYFRDMIFNAWGEQQYNYIIKNNVAIDLQCLKEG